jgi:hypothetical protein
MTKPSTIKETRVKELEAAVRKADKALANSKAAITQLAETLGVANTFEAMVDCEIDLLVEHIVDCFEEAVDMTEQVSRLYL